MIIDPMGMPCDRTCGTGRHAPPANPIQFVKKEDPLPAQLISYDLGKPAREYEKLYEAIKSLGNWWHCLESVWIVKTNKSAAQVRNALTPHIDANDKLAVLTLEGGWATMNLSKECNDWLRNNLAA